MVGKSVAQVNLMAAGRGLTPSNEAKVTTCAWKRIYVKVFTDEKGELRRILIAQMAYGTARICSERVWLNVDLVDHGVYL
jgi:hypothetical protein